MGFLRHNERDVVQVPFVMGDLLAAQVDHEPGRGRSQAKCEQQATERQQMSGAGVTKLRRKPRERRRHSDALPFSASFSAISPEIPVNAAAPGCGRPRYSAAGCSRLISERPRVSGSSSSAMIITPYAARLNIAIAQPRPSRPARKPTNAGNNAPMPRPAL